MAMGTYQRYISNKPKKYAEDNCISAFIPMEKICATYGSEFSYDKVPMEKRLKLIVPILQMAVSPLQRLLRVFKIENLQFSTTYLMVLELEQQS